MDTVMIYVTMVFILLSVAFIKGYDKITTITHCILTVLNFINFIALGILLLDVVAYWMTGNFIVIKSLNTIRFGDNREAVYSYMLNLRQDEFIKELPFILNNCFKLALMNAITVSVLYIAKKEIIMKDLYLTLSVAIVWLIIQICFAFFIGDAFGKSFVYLFR